VLGIGIGERFWPSLWAGRLRWKRRGGLMLMIGGAGLGLIGDVGGKNSYV